MTDELKTLVDTERKEFPAGGYRPVLASMPDV